MALGARLETVRFVGGSHVSLWVVRAGCVYAGVVLAFVVATCKLKLLVA